MDTKKTGTQAKPTFPSKKAPLGGSQVPKKITPEGHVQATRHDTPKGRRTQRKER